MSLDQTFIKIISLEIITLYNELFNVFFKKNKNKIDFLLSEAKKDIINAENNNYFNQFKFIIGIPKIMKSNKNKDDYYVDYDYLNNNFYKAENKEVVSNWNKKLNELEQEFKKEKNDSSINVKDLYKFATFVLDFLTDFEFRKNIIAKIIEVNVNSKTDEFVDIINPQFIQNRSTNSSWNKANL